MTTESTKSGTTSAAAGAATIALNARQCGVSIIIVNWKSAGFLRSCLASLFRETTERFEVIVVDNASYDGSREMAEAEFPGVRFIQSERNLGFSGGNNCGFRAATGDLILLLNPDTELVSDAITTMAALLRSLPRAGAIGCRLLNSDGSVQTSCIQKLPTIANQAFDAEFLRKRFPAWRLWGMRPLIWPPPEPIEVDVVSGACLMVKRSAFEEVGLLSTDYFMYAEDVDLCYRIKRAGYRVFHTGDVEVIHHGGQSSASVSDGAADVWARESTAQFLAKTRGRAYALGYRMAMAAIALIRLLLLGAAFIFTIGRSAHRQVKRTFGKWLQIFLWAAGVTGSTGQPT